MNIVDYIIYVEKCKEYPDVNCLGYIEYYIAKDVDFFIWEKIDTDLYKLKGYNSIKTFNEIIKEHLIENEILYNEQLFYDNADQRSFLYDRLSISDNIPLYRSWINYWVQYDNKNAFDDIKVLDLNK